MNRFEKRPTAANEAQVQYLDGDFRVLRPGLYVLCGVTGAAISAGRIAVLERRPAGGLRQSRGRAAAPGGPRDLNFRSVLPRRDFDPLHFSTL